jgi:hypothetical protein
MASGAAIAAVAGGLLGGGAAVKNVQQRKEKKVKERIQATQNRLKSEAEAAQKLQEEQEKRGTIFAGQPLEENIFRRTLGG